VRTSGSLVAPPSSGCVSVRSWPERRSLGGQGRALEIKQSVLRNPTFGMGRFSAPRRGMRPCVSDTDHHSFRLGLSPVLGGGAGVGPPGIRAGRRAKARLGGAPWLGRRPPNLCRNCGSYRATQVFSGRGTRGFRALSWGPLQESEPSVPLFVVPPSGGLAPVSALRPPEGGTTSDRPTVRVIRVGLDLWCRSPVQDTGAHSTPGPARTA